MKFKHLFTFLNISRVYGNQCIICTVLCTVELKGVGERVLKIIRTPKKIFTKLERHESKLQEAEKKSKKKLCIKITP